MAGDLKVVYTAGTLQEAHFLRNLLEERGICAIVTNADLQGGATLGLWGWEWTSLPRVAVNEENAVTARQIAMDFDRSVGSHAKVTGNEAIPDESPGEIAKRPDMTVHPESLAETWPRCPQCGAPRITKCPACGTSGTGFPPADTIDEEPADAAAARPLLLCIQCDEPFMPEYAHECEWCGHEFLEGFRPADVVEATDLSPGLLLALGVTLLVVIGLLAYFAALVSHAGS